MKTAQQSTIWQGWCVDSTINMYLRREFHNGNTGSRHSRVVIIIGDLQTILLSWDPETSWKRRTQLAYLMALSIMQQLLGCKTST